MLKIRLTCHLHGRSTRCVKLWLTLSKTNIEALGTSKVGQTLHLLAEVAAHCEQKINRQTGVCYNKGLGRWKWFWYPYFWFVSCWGWLRHNYFCREVKNRCVWTRLIFHGTHCAQAWWKVGKFVEKVHLESKKHLSG